MFCRNISEMIGEAKRVKKRSFESGSSTTTGEAVSKMTEENNGNEEIKKKRKSSNQRKKKNKEPAAPTPAKDVKIHQDELDSYIEEWSKKNVGASNSWKFNKRVQCFLVDNCLDENVVSSETFDKSVAYLMSIVGNTRERLVEQAKKVIDNTEIDRSDESVLRAQNIVDNLA